MIYGMHHSASDFLHLEPCAIGTNRCLLAGTLPDAWAGWNVTALALCGNYLSGQLPTSWGRSWPSLKTMVLNSNLLTGVFAVDELD